MKITGTCEKVNEPPKPPEIQPWGNSPLIEKILALYRLLKVFFIKFITSEITLIFSFRQM